MSDHYTLHPHGIYQIRLPMDNPPWVNSYLLPDGDGYTLIDPGFNTEEIVALWHEVSAEIGFTFDQIRQIVVTHHHPDHYGLAGWLQQRSGAPVYASTVAKQQIEALWGEGQPLLASLLGTYRTNGLPEQLVQQLEQQLHHVQRVLPPAALTLLDEGDTLRIGDNIYDVLSIPGHAAGHIALYSKLLRIIFVGDQVRPDSLPDTCYVADEFDPSPIHSFLQSLDKLQRYDAELAFPGHHHPFGHVGERLEKLKQLNDERQQKVLEQFGGSDSDGEGQWKTAYEAYYDVFEPVPSLFQKRFHFTETISRVRYALSEGLLEQSERNGVVTYRKAAAERVEP